MTENSTTNNVNVTEEKIVDSEGIEMSNFVLVRTESAGVHVGIVKDYNDETGVITLTQSRRIHYWKGACSCTEIALNGIADTADSRIALILPIIKLRGWIEIIPMTKKAAKCLMEAPTWEMATLK